MGIAFSLGLNLPQLALAVMIAAPLKRYVSCIAFVLISTTSPLGTMTMSLLPFPS